MAARDNIRALTARLWLACWGHEPLVLPVGRYATDGWKLWRLDGEEEAKAVAEGSLGIAQEAGSASQASHQANGDPRAGTEYAERARLHGRGDGGDEGAGQRGHGVRQLRRSADRRGGGGERSEHRFQVPQLRGVQRNLGLEQSV